VFGGGVGESKGERPRSRRKSAHYNGDSNKTSTGKCLQGGEKFVVILNGVEGERVRRTAVRERIVSGCDRGKKGKNSQLSFLSKRNQRGGGGTKLLSIPHRVRKKKHMVWPWARKEGTKVKRVTAAP